MFKNIFKNTGWLFLAEAMNKGTFFLITIIIARSFGSELFGQFNYAISFVIIFSVIADFGINNLIVREVARDKENIALLIGSSLIIKIFLSILTILLIIVSTIFTHKSLEVNTMVYILSFYVIFNSYNTFSKSIYRAFEKMKFETFLKFVESITLLLYVSAVSIYVKDLKTLILGFALASLITFLISVKWIKKFFTKFIFKFNKKTILFILKETWPFALAGIFVTLYFNIDTVMVSWIKGDIETGLYSVAYNFIFAASLIPALLNASFYPILSREYKNLFIIKKQIIKYLYLTIGLGVFLSGMLFLLSEFLIKIIYGNEYVNSVYSLRILALVLPFLFLFNYLGIIFSSINKQLVVTVVSFIGIILNIILNFYLINKFGQVGAAMASLVTIIVMLISFMFYCKFNSRLIYEK